MREKRVSLILRTIKNTDLKNKWWKEFGIILSTAPKVGPDATSNKLQTRIFRIRKHLKKPSKTLIILKKDFMGKDFYRQSLPKRDSTKNIFFTQIIYNFGTLLRNSLGKHTFQNKLYSNNNQRVEFLFAYKIFYQQYIHLLLVQNKNLFTSSTSSKRRHKHI